jgi:DNA helicase HerA-like ATPase
LKGRRVGYIVGEVDTNVFWFVSDLDSFPPRYEYLIIPGVGERDGAEFKTVDVLAQVSRIANYSDILGRELSLRELETIINRYGSSAKVFGTANVLGYLDEGGSVVFPRSAAVPGQEVFVAPSELLETFFTKNIAAGIQIGGLITRPGVRVSIDPNGFRRHVAVIAQTGAGKSYLVGVVLERLLPLGATVIVFDPNSDYVMMRTDHQGEPLDISGDVRVFRPPGIRGRRYSDEEIGGSEDYTIDFSTLDSDHIADVAGISPNWAVQREAVSKAVDMLTGIYGPEQLVEALRELPQMVDKRIGKAAVAAITYLQRLIHYRIWGNQDIPLDDLVRPKRMSIIDLAGLQRRVSEYIVTKTLSDLWSRAVTGNMELPVFVVLEEAHNLVPGRGFGSAMSSSIIERIAAEGRKFGIFLLVVTQRPNKISSNVLSQCNSQIIMRLTNPEDMSAVRRSSEGLSEDLFRDLPGLNRGEAIVVGELTKVPTMVNISGRQSREGGSDIDVVGSLERGLELYELRRHTQLSSEEDDEISTEW